MDRLILKKKLQDIQFKSLETSSMATMLDAVPLEEEDRVVEELYQFIINFKEIK